MLGRLQGIRGCSLGWAGLRVEAGCRDPYFESQTLRSWLEGFEDVGGDAGTIESANGEGPDVS